MIRKINIMTHIKNKSVVIITVLAMISLLSCAGTPEHQVNVSPDHTSATSTSNAVNIVSPPEPGINDKTNALILDRAMNASQHIDYVLGPDDLIEIDVFQVDDLKRTVRVSSSGFIKLPLAGKIEVTGFTIPALENEINRRLESYLQEPVVSVFIKEYRSQRITVLGAVKKPQVHAVTGQKFLLDMLSMSEGLKEDAGDICYIQRGDETILINFNELLVQGNARLNVPVFAGDVIHVPKGGVVFVSGAVIEPGSFVMQGSITLTQAIAMAKGLKYEAMKSGMRIYRDTGSEIRDTIDVDYDKVLARESSDVILKDKDIIIVPKSGAKSFFKGFVETLGGFISFGKAL
jgi:polysaccharide export outer membrane protein